MTRTPEQIAAERQYPNAEFEPCGFLQRDAFIVGWREYDPAAGAERDDAVARSDRFRMDEVGKVPTWSYKEMQRRATAAEAEVERLTRQRDEWKRRYHERNEVMEKRNATLHRNLEEKRAEVERLTRERDEWHQRAVDEYNVANACVADEVALDKAEAQLTKARAEVERLTRERDEAQVNTKKIPKDSS